MARIVLNSTIGLGGLFDVASRIGIPYHDNDFGITLGRAGTAEGSYLMLPILGPKPPRDLWAWAWTACSIPLPGRTSPAATNS